MKIITVKDLKSQLSKFTIIDVREPNEHKSGFIPGAILVPLQDLSYEKLPSYSLPIVFYCRSGRRSEEACEILAEHSAPAMYSLEDGILGWKAAGYRVEKSPNIFSRIRIFFSKN